MGSKNRCNFFSTEFFDRQIQSKNEKVTFSTVSPCGKLSRKRPFSTDESDCVINGLGFDFDNFGVNTHVLCKLRDTPAVRFYRCTIL